MTVADTLGWIAATLMVATFSCRDPAWMRPFAVCTNIAFICYGFSAGLAPVLALHALLLPINLFRWWQGGRTPARRPIEADIVASYGGGAFHHPGDPSGSRA